MSIRAARGRGRERGRGRDMLLPWLPANRACFLRSGGQDYIDHVLKPWSSPCFLVFSASVCPAVLALFGPLKTLSLTLAVDGGLLLLKWTLTASPAREKYLLCFAHVLPKFTSLNCQPSGEQETVRANPVTVLPGLMLPH